MIQDPDNPRMFANIDVMLRVAYMAEVTPPAIKSPLLLLIQKAEEDRGYVETKKNSVNFRGMDDLEVRAQLLMIRMEMKRILSGALLHFIWSKYSQMQEQKEPGMQAMARLIHQSLSRRGIDEAKRIIFFLHAPPSVCNRWSPRNISRKLQIPIATVNRDIDDARKALKRYQEKAFAKIILFYQNDDFF